MPQFNPGDRVRCIRTAPNGRRFGVVGQVYTVVSCIGISMALEEIQGICNSGRFELVVEPPAPIPEPQSTTFYTLVYKTRHTTKRTMGFLTEREFNEKKTAVLQQGGTVFGEKKLKLNNV